MSAPPTISNAVSSPNTGHVMSTKRLLPAKLKSYVAVETEVHARDLKIYFKSGSGKAAALKRLFKMISRSGHSFPLLRPFQLICMVSLWE
jgi:hypothetical protein